MVELSALFRQILIKATPLFRHNPYKHLNPKKSLKNLQIRTIFRNFVT